MKLAAILQLPWYANGLIPRRFVSSISYTQNGFLLVIRCILLPPVMPPPLLGSFLGRRQSAQEIFQAVWLDFLTKGRHKNTPNGFSSFLLVIKCNGKKQRFSEEFLLHFPFSFCRFGPGKFSPKTSGWTDQGYSTYPHTGTPLFRTINFGNKRVFTVLIWNYPDTDRNLSDGYEAGNE